MVHRVTGIGKTSATSTPTAESSVFPNTITTVIMSPDITDIGDYAFSDKQSVSRVVYSPNLTSVGQYAFNNCIALTNCDLADSISNIGQWSFKGCSQVKA